MRDRELEQLRNLIRRMLHHGDSNAEDVLEICFVELLDATLKRDRELRFSGVVYALVERFGEATVTETVTRMARAVSCAKPVAPLEGPHEEEAR